MLSALAALELEVTARLRRSLPDDFAELFLAPGGGPPADLAAGAGVPPAELTDQPDGSYRIEIWTHSEDQVTDLDVPFALAVEDLIDDVLGERQPTRTQPPERGIDPRRPPAGPVPGTSDRRRRQGDH